MNRSEIEKKWRQEGFSFATWMDPPGERWEEFSHSADRKVLVMEGELELEIEGRVQTLKKGEEFIIPAGSIYSIRNRGNRVTKWLYGFRYLH